jgi:hypothetical protein
LRTIEPGMARSTNTFCFAIRSQPTSGVRKAWNSSRAPSGNASQLGIGARIASMKASPRTLSSLLLFFAEPGALIQAPVVEWARSALPNLETVDLGAGIHYVQEDHPEIIGREVARFVADL